MPNSAERSKPVEATIMLILLFAGFGFLAWAIGHEAETNGTPKHPVKKQTYVIEALPCYDSVGNCYYTKRVYDHVPTAEDSIEFKNESGIKWNDK
jgi:hypothetical protein